ncbi:hypothetical protein EB001_25140 [bacterium]|nr:hypothetical protein [bacterium]
MPQPKPFNQGRKAAGKKAAAKKVKNAAKAAKATNTMRTALQLAMPIPGPAKAKAAVKAVGAVAKKVTKPRNVVLITNRASDATMAKAAKTVAIRQNMQKGAASPQNVKKYAGKIREMLKETDPKKRIAMSKKVVRKKSK